MIKYFCDRCGKESEELIHVALKFDPWELFSAETLLICHKCHDKLKNFFKEVENE